MVIMNSLDEIGPHCSKNYKVTVPSIPAITLINTTSLNRFSVIMLKIIKHSGTAANLVWLKNANKYDI